MDSTPTKSPKTIGHIVLLVLRILGCLLMLAVGTVLALLAEHFFHRGGSMLALPSALAFITAAILIFARKEKALTLGFGLVILVSASFVYLGIHG